MNLKMDIVLDDFVDAIKICFLPIIVVYRMPKDYPKKYVARLWDVNKPTEYLILKNSLEEIRAVIPDMMARFSPGTLDDPVIVETYL